MDLRFKRRLAVGVAASVALVLPLLSAIYLASVATNVSAAAEAQKSEPARSPNSPVAQLLEQLSRSIGWQSVQQTPLQWDTFHPQGMVRIGDRFFMSSVQVLEQPVKCTPSCDGYDRTPGKGIGHLFEFDTRGHLIHDLQLGAGIIYHPGGIDFDGTYVWVPVSEYRPHSHAIIYRVNPADMTATVVFRFNDHIGGITRDEVTGQLVGNNWGSRTFYTWNDKGTLLRHVNNPEQYIDYQDCHYVPSRKMVCDGIAALPEAGNPSGFQLGGLSLLDLPSEELVNGVPLTQLSPRNDVLTRNPFWIEANNGRLRLYTVPDDDMSSLLVYDSDLLVQASSP